MVATSNNSFGQAMLKVSDAYLNEVGADGLYWDEMEGIDYGEPLITYNIADGYSCELDPQTYTINREIGINTILGEEYRINVIKHLRDNGADLLGNGPIATKRILALKPQRMIEIQHNDYWHYEGNLGTPLGYASSSVGFNNWIRALNMATLLVGTKYKYDYDISAYVFPFTPIEIHPGYMLGEERIIATHSGNYGWSGAKDIVQVRYFNKDGKLIPKKCITKIDEEARTKSEVENGEAVVLIRIPAKIKSQESLKIHSAAYSQTGLSFVADAPDGFTMEMKHGELPVSPGRIFELRTGASTSRIFADENGILTIKCPPSDEEIGIHLKPLEKAQSSNVMPE